MCGNIQIRPYGTHVEAGVLVTPMGNYNILHYEYPTDEEIKQLVQEVIKEIMNEEVFEDNCLLCQFMEGPSYGVAYYCQSWCHECNKDGICLNFNPNSREE